VTSLTERARRIGEKLDPGWDGPQLETRLDGLHRRLRRRRRTRLAAAVAVTALVAGLGIHVATDRGAGSESLAIAPPERDAAPRLVTPRAVATPLSADAVVYTSEDRRDAVAMRLERGAARFEVRHLPEETFRIDAGPVLVEVLGTEFTIARDAHQATVTVIRGVVRVHWQGGSAVLRTGESGTFPPVVAPLPPPSPRSQPRTPPPASPATPPAPPVEPSVDELLAAADQARLAGRGDEAVSLLERALARSPDPQREAVAAFALGNLRSRRGELELAARAFARAHAANPDGALAEDALAREVEAWAHARDAGRATEAARRYQERYPDGRRRKLVRECLDGL
jgi:transmembrane sensor